MKVTHFQRECNINSNSYGRFMKLKGPSSGIDNQTYEAAFIFFKKRELAGIKPPKRKKAKAEDLDKFDVGDPVLKLDGEDEGEVEIYDTCGILSEDGPGYRRQCSVSSDGEASDTGGS